MTMLDFFGKIIATGGFLSFVSFFLVIMFGNSMLKAAEDKPQHKKTTESVLGYLCIAFVTGLAFIVVGSLGYIWAR